MARQDASDKKKRKNCSLCADKVEAIDYKQSNVLEKLQLSITFSINLKEKDR